MYKDYIPYSLEMISTITRHQVGTVERAMKIFEQLKLVEVLDNGEETERLPDAGGIDSRDAGTGAGETASRKTTEAEKGNRKEGRHDAAL